VSLDSGEVGINQRRRAMRLRTIAAAVGLVAVLVAGVATLTRGQEKARPAADRAKLRSQVVRLRVAVELLELKHDADRAALSEALKGLRQWRLRSTFDSGLDSAAATFGFMGNEAERAMKKAAEEGKDLQGAFKGVAATYGKKMAADIERLEEGFTKRATELNERRLELADAEKAYKAAE
jgi:hypothetical protein